MDETEQAEQAEQAEPPEDELEEPVPPVGASEPLGVFELVREWLGARFGRRR